MTHGKRSSNQVILVVGNASGWSSVPIVISTGSASTESSIINGEPQQAAKHLILLATLTFLISPRKRRMFFRSTLPHVIKAAPDLLRPSAQWQSTMLLGAPRSSYRTFPQVHPPWIIVFFRLASQGSATQHFEVKSVYKSMGINKVLGWLERLVGHTITSHLRDQPNACRPHT